METKKKRGRPKKTASEFACGKVSGRKNPRNPEVFVLPPEILRQLGIYLNKQPEFSNQNAGLPQHRGQVQLAAIQPSRKNEVGLQEMKIQKSSNDISHDTEYELPKRIDAKVQLIVEPKKSASPISRPSTSIMETANLMKESLFLSPTFSHVNSNKSSVVDNSLELKHISDNLNDSATTTSIIDDLPGDVNISGLSIGGLNEVLNSAVDLVSEETHFKDSSLTIDNGSNYSMEYEDDLVDSVSKENTINTGENINIENQCEIIEENRVCSENIEFLKEIQEMSDENILLEIYDMSKTNLSDNNVADCNILESPYELDNTQICVRATPNANNEYNQDVSKYVMDANLLETSQDTSESKYDTEGSRDSNITVGREDYIFTNLPYITSTPMINASDIDMDIESGSMQDCNNFVDTCLWRPSAPQSNGSNTITADTITDGANTTVISNVDYFDINSENRNNDSSTITSETTLSVVEAFGHVQDINSNHSQNLPVKENFIDSFIDTPSQLVIPNVSAEGKKSSDQVNKNKVNIISETIIKSSEHNEMLSQFVNKVLTSNTSKSPVSLDHNIQLADDPIQTSNLLNKFISSRKECETVSNLDEISQSFVIDKHQNLKCNQRSDDIVLSSAHSKSDNEIDFVKGYESTKKFDSKVELSAKYESEENIYGSPRKYMPVKDSLHVQSSPVESGIFLDNRPSYNLENLKSCPKSNKICIVSPLNIFSKKDNVKNSYSTDTFEKNSPNYYNKAKIHRYDLNIPEPETTREKLVNSPKLSDSVIKMLLDSPSNHDTLTSDIEVTTVIPAYVHTSSIIADASNVVESVSNLNCEGTGEIVALNDNTNCLMKKVCAMECEITSRIKSLHGKQIKDSEFLNVDNQTSHMNPKNVFIPADEKCSTSRLMPENIADLNNMYLKPDANRKEMKSDGPSSSTTDAQVALIAKYIKAAIQACEKKAKYQNNINRSVKNRTIKNKDKTLFRNYKCYPSRKILNTHGVEKPGGNLSVDVKLNKTETDNNCSQLKTSDVELHLFEDTLNEKIIEHVTFEYPEESGISADNELNSSNTSTGSQDTKELIDVSNFGSVSYNNVENFITNENVSFVNESVDVYVVVEETANETKETVVATDKGSELSELQIKSSFMKSNCQKKKTILENKDDIEQMNDLHQENISDKIVEMSSRVGCEIVVKEENLDGQEIVSGNILYVNIENNVIDMGAATHQVLELCNDESVDSKIAPKTIVNSFNPKGVISEFNRTDKSNNSLHISEQTLNSNMYVEEILDENFSSKKQNKDVGEVIIIPKLHSLGNINLIENVERDRFKSDDQFTPCNLDKQVEGPLAELKMIQTSSDTNLSQKIYINDAFDGAAKNKIIVEKHKDLDESMDNKLQVSSYAEDVTQSSIFYKAITGKDFDMLHSESNVSSISKPMDEIKDPDDTLFSKAVNSEATLVFENDDENNGQIEIPKYYSDNELDDHSELSNDAYSDMDIANMESVVNNNNDVEKDIPVLERNLSHPMINNEQLKLTKTMGLRCTNSRDLSDIEMLNRDNEIICQLDITNKIIDEVSCVRKDLCPAQKISTGLCRDVNEGEGLQSLNTTEKAIMEIINEKSEHEQTNEKLKPFKKRDINNQISNENLNIEQSETWNISEHIDTEEHLPTMADQDLYTPINKDNSKIEEVRNFVQAEIINMPDKLTNSLAMQHQSCELEASQSGLNLINQMTSKAIDVMDSGAQTQDINENPSINAIKRKRGRPKKEATKLLTSTVADNSLNLSETRATTYTTSLDSTCAQINSDERKPTEKIESYSTPVPKKRDRPKRNVTTPSSSTQNGILNSTFGSAVSRSENVCAELDYNTKMQNKDEVSVAVKENIETIRDVSQNQSSGSKRGRPKKIVSELGQVKKKRGRPRRNLQESTKNSSLTEKEAFNSTEKRSINLSMLENPADESLYVQRDDIESKISIEGDKNTCSKGGNHKAFEGNLETLLVTEENNKKEIVSELGQVKKKRGRPRRNLQESTKNSSLTEKEAFNSTEKRSINLSMLENPADESLYVQRDDIESKISIEGDKNTCSKGGNHKAFEGNLETLLVTEENNKKEIVSELGQVKKKRGRPRRNLQESTKNSSLTEKEASNSTEEISSNSNILENPADKSPRVQREAVESETSIQRDKNTSNNADINKLSINTLKMLLVTGEKNRRGRKKTQLPEESGLKKIKDSTPTEESREPTNVSKHSKKRIVDADVEFCGSSDNVETQHFKRHKKNIERLSNATIKLDDELIKKVGENSVSQEVTIKCGLCGVEVASDLWFKHSAVEHNCLAHHSGEEPINIEDSKLVIKLLGRIHKQLSEDFKCKICGLVRCSASGFYAHIVSCQKGESTTHRKGKKLMYPEPEVPTTAIVKCAVCSEEMPNNAWSQHLLSVHNNLAWFEGAKPIDLQNEKMVLAILIRVAKDTQSITCKKCGTTRASALGFITHMAVCQKTEEEIENMKISCEVCQKVFMPGAMRTHMNTHINTLFLADKTLEDTAEEDPQSVDSGGKRKRAAAKVAERSFAKLEIETAEENINWKVYYKEPFNGRAHTISIHRWHSNVKNNKPNRCYHIGCKYKDATVEGIKKHYEEECPFINKDYQCRRCNFCTETFEIIKLHALDKHVKKTHSSSDSDTQVHVPESEEEDEDDEQFDNERAKVVREELDEKVAARIGRLRPVKPMVPKLIPNWTKQLYERHLSKDTMFVELTCQPAVQVSMSDALQYLPITQESCSVAYLDFIVDLGKRKDTFTDWTKYNIFESTVFNGAVSMFCGGPVQCMAWAPTKDLTAQDAEEQLLAISIHKDFSEEGYPSLSSYSHSNMLQFWSFSSLSNERKCNQPARFVLGLCHKYGVVWDMAWCPSGGHMEGTNGIPARIGLLSVACSNGLAYIFAIQDPTELKGSETQFYKTTPVMELRLDISCSERLNYQATSITWSIEKGHNVIAVGYSHSYVALFDLTIESPLLHTVESGIMIIGPYYNSPDMLSPVTGLTIFPRKQEESNVEEGIILGAGSTSGASLWSRYGTSNQICLVHKKINVTATFCVPHWPNLVCSLDNSSAKIGAVEVALRSLSWEQPRNDDAASQRVLSSAAACLSVHNCWWSGLAMQSTGSGKLLVLSTLHPSYYACRPRTQILTEYDLVTLKDKQPASEASLDTYDATVKDHGIVIREYTFDSNTPAKLAPHVNKAPWFSCKSYSLTNVTSISINPCASACSFVARGLQCGFLHVAPVRKCLNL